MFIIQALVSLDPKLQVIIVALVGLAFAAGVNLIPSSWQWLKGYLGQYKDQVIGYVSALVIAWINVYLGLIPAQFEDLASAILNVLVVLAVTFGLPFLTFQYLRRKNVAAFR